MTNQATVEMETTTNSVSLVDLVSLGQLNIPPELSARVYAEVIVPPGGAEVTIEVNGRLWDSLFVWDAGPGVINAVIPAWSDYPLLFAKRRLDKAISSVKIACRVFNPEDVIIIRNFQVFPMLGGD